MKKILFAALLLLTANLLNAQSPSLEVLLIGASHQYEPGQDMTGIHSKIRAFQPDAFFGEWLSPEDEKDLLTYWNKKNVDGRTRRLRANKDIPDEKLPGLIQELKAKVAANPGDFFARIDLAHAYYLSQEAGNGYYQMWQVSKELKRDPSNQALFDYSALVRGPWQDTPQKFIDSYTNNEYDLIAFPMMMELKKDWIYPMDCQAYDVFWSEAWAYSDSLESVYKEQLRRNPDSGEALFYSAVKKKEAAMAAQTKGESVAGYKQSQMTEILNTPEADNFLNRVNLVSPELLGLRGFPAYAFQEKLHWWLMRNITMCNNTVERARAAGLKKVVIIVGAGHRWPMATLFGEMPGVKVVNINDYGK